MLQEAGSEEEDKPGTGMPIQGRKSFQAAGQLTISQDSPMGRLP